MRLRSACIYAILSTACSSIRIDAQIADSFNAASDNLVHTVTAQTDGRVLVGGEFTSLNGGLYAFGRLLSDGSIDQSFVGFKSPGFGPSTVVNCSAIQTNGLIWVGGQIYQYDRENLLRLNANGTVDTNFDGGFLGAGVSVNCLDFQPDGKLLVCGSFTELLGQPMHGLARLNVDGSLDASFQPKANNSVFNFALQPDGKLVVYGLFTSIGGQPCNYIGRLNQDGTLDTNFNASVNRNLPIECLLAQPDGKILVGGLFMSLDGQSRTNLGRLNSDGSLDTDFNPQPDDHNSWGITSLLLQTDGKILVGGDFVTMKGVSRPNLARLNSDGTLDTNFDAHVIGAAAISLGVQNDEHILTGGAFYSVGGAAHVNIARFQNAGTATQTLSFDGTNIVWLRGGSSMEVSHTSFEAFDGTNWLNLGGGTRIPDGWQLTNVLVNASAKIRARGFLTGGKFNGSSFFLESTTGSASETPPIIVVNDGAFGFQSNLFGFTIQAGADQLVVIDGSTDLRNWTPMATNLFQTNSMHFRDDLKTNVSHQFYRSRLQR